MKMNNKQLIVLWVGIAVFVLVGLIAADSHHIDTDALYVLWVLVAVLTSGLIYTLGIHPDLFHKIRQGCKAAIASAKQDIIVSAKKESYKNSVEPTEETQSIGVCAKCGRQIRKDEKICMLGSTLLCQECFKKASTNR